MESNIISPRKKIYSSEELRAEGVSYYKIAEMVKDRKLMRLNKSYYQNVSYKGRENDFYFVPAYVPQGIICLMSAAVYYNLTSFMPDRIDVAVGQKNIVSQNTGSIYIKPYYFSEARLAIGVKKIREGRNCFRIFDIEKTVIDIISFRNKVGIEDTKEILINYLSRPGRKINQLYRYAGRLGCLKTLKTYLEVLL